MLLGQDSQHGMEQCKLEPKLKQITVIFFNEWKKFTYIDPRAKYGITSILQKRLSNLKLNREVTRLG